MDFRLPTDDMVGPCVTGYWEYSSEYNGFADCGHHEICLVAFYHEILD